MTSKSVQRRLAVQKTTKVGRPGDGKVVLVDAGLTLPDDRRAWLERRGYAILSLPCLDELQGREAFLLLSPRASWWADDMWPMLEAVVKLREKEAANAKA